MEQRVGDFFSGCIDLNLFTKTGPLGVDDE